MPCRSSIGNAWQTTSFLCAYFLDSRFLPHKCNRINPRLDHLPPRAIVSQEQGHHSTSILSKEAPTFFQIARLASPEHDMTLTVNKRELAGVSNPIKRYECDLQSVSLQIHSASWTSYGLPAGHATLISCVYLEYLWWMQILLLCEWMLQQ